MRQSGGPGLTQNLLFCPAAHWLVQSLAAAGVEHFFIITGDSLTFPEGCEAVSGQDPELDAKLKAFAAQAGGAVLSVTRPVWLSYAGAALLTGNEPLPAGGEETGIWRTSNLAEQGLSGLATGEPFSPSACEEPLAVALQTAEDVETAQYLGRYDVVFRHTARGVRFLDLDTAYIDPTVEIGAGTLILPGTILRGRTVIGENCEIGPNTMIRDCEIGHDTVVNASQLNESTVGSHTNVGPFAYLRPNSHVGDAVKVGDFVEVKNSSIGDGTKISHLTYVGDSDVGEQVNFGCGTVTVNYDGNQKYRTTIGDRCFLGCNTNLVAPVTVEDGAFTAAGTTVTGRVPAGALAIGRARQENKEGWALRHRAKKK
ncbi:MAG: hypothetical protein HFF18_06795 [Oscillospiraceae bacterium]|nr:hypothetical protein [Oscillospiraceae bacterium]